MSLPLGVSHKQLVSEAGSVSWWLVASLVCSLRGLIERPYGFSHLDALCLAWWQPWNGRQNMPV